jgi:hypothetical protein
MHATFLAHLILSSLYMTKTTSYEAPHYAVFFNFLSLHLSLDQIFSSAPCSQTSSVYIPHLMLETKIHTSTEPQIILWFCIFYQKLIYKVLIPWRYQLLLKYILLPYRKIIFQRFKHKFVRKFCSDLPVERNRGGAQVSSYGGAYVACFKLLKSPSLVLRYHHEYLFVGLSRPWPALVLFTWISE